MHQVSAQFVAGGVRTPAGVGNLAKYFLWLGATGFGGPIALAARMQRDLVNERGWICDVDYLDGLAFAQLAPGPLAAQLAMYLGYVNGGIAGATIAGVAFVLPSFLIVLGLSVAYAAFGGLMLVQAVFYGIAPVVIGIIAVAACRLAAKVVKRDPLLITLSILVGAWTVVSQRELAVLFVLAGLATLLVRHKPRGTHGLSSAWLIATTSAVNHGTVFTLFLFFSKAALFVFGSGLAIVPFLYAGVVQEHRWLTEQQFVDAVAIAMITPGPVVITVAFIGYIVAGVKGALVAAAGIFAPVYLMVILLAPIFRRHSNSDMLRSFVAGVTAAAAGGIAGAAIVLASRSIHDLFGGVLCVIAIVAVSRSKWAEPLLIAGGGLIGIGRQILG